AYTRLPDLFVALDLRRADGTFLDAANRRATLADAGLTLPPLVGRGVFTIDQLEAATDRSAWSDEPAEGVVVRPLRPHPVRIAKLVRAGFVPVDDSTWRRGRPQNRLAWPAPGIGPRRPERSAEQDGRALGDRMAVGTFGDDGQLDGLFRVGHPEAEAPIGGRGGAGADLAVHLHDPRGRPRRWLAGD